MVNRTRFTLGQAAIEIGKSKAALSKAIAEGRLSATKNDKGWYSIDAAELFRVYESVQGKRQPDTLANPELLQQLLQKEVDERRNERLMLQATIDDLRKRLDHEQEHVKRLTLFLEHLPTEDKPVKKKKKGKKSKGDDSLIDRLTQLLKS